MAAAGPDTPRILVTRKMMPDAEARIASLFRATLNPDDRPMSSEEILRAAAGHDGILLTSFDKLGPAFIPALPQSIRIIATHSVGYDHLSIPQAEARGIAVTNTPGVLTDATADIAMLLILGAARGASWGDRMVREDRWGETTLISPMGHDVSGRRLGILGMGRIGQAIARRGALGFGMRVLYHNRSRLAPELEAPIGARYVDKATLLRESDHLVLVLPYSAGSHHAIGAAVLAQMKPSATLWYVGRGGIVDDAALAQGLRERRIAGAALDVFEGEPSVHPGLLEVPNVVLTPHIASATVATRRAMAELAADNLIAALTGGVPPTPINPEVLGRPR